MEQFVIRTLGGPEQGLYFADDTTTSWPLPEMLAAPGGHYQKVRESQMPQLDGPAAQHLVRGAEYQWVDDQEIATDQSSDGTPVEDMELHTETEDGDWIVGQET